MSSQTDPIYIQGQSPEEYQRLKEQSSILGDFTEDFLQNIRIQTGMRVLDLGCGVGDVSLLLGRLVGPSGSVVGVDRDAGAIEIARQRARSAGFDHVSFIHSDIRQCSFDTLFDAVVGRFVLMYIPNPVECVRRISQFVKSGGVVAFQEFDYSTYSSEPDLPLWTQACNWYYETASKAGIEMRMGHKLYGTLLQAGLVSPFVRMDMRVVGGNDLAPYRYFENTIRNVLPMMERFGVATAREVEVDTFATRLRDAVVAGGGVIVLFPIARGWAFKP